MDSKNHYDHKFIMYLSSNFKGGGCTALHEFIDRAQTAIVATSLGEDIETLQAKLNEAVSGHRQKVREEFEEKYPTVNLDALWDNITGLRYAMRKFATPIFKSNDKELISAFINVTAWVRTNEGTNNSAGKFPLSKLCFFVDMDEAQLREHVQPVAFNTICSECAKSALAHACSASVRRQILGTKVICGHCGHVHLVASPNSIENLGDSRVFQTRLECICKKCIALRTQVVLEAGSRAEEMINKSIEQIIENVEENKHEYIPLTANTNATESTKREMAVFESGLFERGDSLEDTIKCIALGENEEISQDGIDEIVYQGLHSGYLKAVNIQMDSDGAFEEVRNALETNRDWDGKYSLSQLESDLKSEDIWLVLRGIRKFKAITQIQSPLKATLTYRPGRYSVLVDMASQLKKIAEDAKSTGRLGEESIDSIYRISEQLSQLG